MVLRLASFFWVSKANLAFPVRLGVLMGHEFQFENCVAAVVASGAAMHKKTAKRIYGFTLIVHHTD